MKRHIVIAIVTALVLALILPLACAKSGAVIFTDENLEAAIRDALGKQVDEEITAVELAELTELAADGLAIADLTGIEYCMNLTSLSLWDNQISDISPLSSLTGLTWLYLDGNQISDLSPLSNLTSLTELLLDWNQISDISPLSNLTNLTWLRLSRNQINDIQPLVANSGLSEGDIVELRNNPLSTTSVDVYARQLEGRGVSLFY